MRYRTKVTKGPGPRQGITMAFNLIQAAQTRWRKVNAPQPGRTRPPGATFHQGKLLERPTEITPTEPAELSREESRRETRAELYRRNAIRFAADALTRVTHDTADHRPTLPPQTPVDSGGMADFPLDAQERLELCDLLDELGPSVPTLLEGWTAHDLTAHIVLRERDLVAGPCIVLPGPFQRFAERRRVRLAESKDFTWLVARIRSGPPIGFFRIGWVRSLANLNEFFVHHEDVRRANKHGPRPRSLTPAMDAALWRNVRRGSRYLSRRLQACGLEIEWAGTDERVTVRPGEPTAQLSGPPGELLLYVFGRQAAAQVEVSGPPDAVAAVRRTHFGM